MKLGAYLNKRIVPAYELEVVAASGAGTRVLLLTLQKIDTGTGQVRKTFKASLSSRRTTLTKEEFLMLPDEFHDFKPKQFARSYAPTMMVKIVRKKSAAIQLADIAFGLVEGREI